MPPDQTEGAVNQVEDKVAATGGDVTSTAVADEVSSVLTSPDHGNIIANADMTQAFATRLENEGILPGMVIDQLDAGNLNNWRTGDNLDRAKVEKAAADSSESPLNRMMAQALLARYKDLDTTPGDGLSRAELAAWSSKQTTTEDGSTVYRNAQGQPERIEHPAVGDQPAGETVIKRDGQGNPIAITPPEGGVGVPLELKDGKWQVKDNPDPSSEITNVVVQPDGTYSFNFKNASDQYTVTQKTDGSTVFTTPDGNVMQVDRGIKGLRAFEASPPDNPTEIKVDGGATTYKKTDSGWENTNDPNDKYTSIKAAADGTVTFTRADNTATVHNTDRSVVSLDASGQPTNIKYADGTERGFTWTNGQITQVTELGVTAAAPAGAAVDRGGNYSYNEGGERKTVHSTGARTSHPLEAAVEPVEPVEPPVTLNATDVGTGGNDIKGTKEGNDYTSIERTNQNGEKEKITRNADGGYTIQRTGADGAVTTEFAKPGTFKPEEKDGKLVGYSYDTVGGSHVEQRADGSRLYRDASGSETVYTYGADGKPTKVEHTGKGGVTETLTFENGQWNLSRPDNSGGGKVDSLKINSDGSYSYKFMGTEITQETQRNIREEKRPNGDAVRMGFDNNGNPEFVVRNFTTHGQSHQEEVKLGPDGKTWQVTVDGKPQDVKDVKVYNGGGYEFTLNATGSKIYQDGNTRRETRTDGTEISTTVLPDSSTEDTTKLPNGDTQTIKKDATGKPVAIIHTSKETGIKETVTVDAEGNPTGIVVSDTANPDKKFEVKNLQGSKGNYSYDLVLDPANPNKVRHVEQNLDGSRKEVTLEPYAVQKGDNLTKLAAQRGVTIQDIIDAQSPEVKARLQKNPNLILTGETLVMPSDKKEVKAPTAPGAGPQDNPNKEDYTVQAGDTLTKIARDRGISIPELIAEVREFDPKLADRLEANKNFIRTGEKIPVKKRAK